MTCIKKMHGKDSNRLMTKIVPMFNDKAVCHKCMYTACNSWSSTWMSTLRKSIQQLLRYHRLDQRGRLTDRKIDRTALPPWKTDTWLTKRAARPICPEVFVVYAAVKQAAEDDGRLTKKGSHSSREDHSTNLRHPLLHRPAHASMSLLIWMESGSRTYSTSPRATHSQHWQP